MSSALCRSAIFLTLLACVSACSGGPTAPAPVESTAAPSPSTAAPSTPSSPSSPTSAEAASVVQLTNAERSAAGVPAVAVNSRLMLAAQLHADQMAQLQRLDHTLQDGQYPTPADRLTAAGYTWRTYGENIAFN